MLTIIRLTNQRVRTLIAVTTVITTFLRHGSFAINCADRDHPGNAHEHPQSQLAGDTYDGCQFKPIRGFSVVWIQRSGWVFGLEAVS